MAFKKTIFCNLVQRWLKNRQAVTLHGARYGRHLECSSDEDLCLPYQQPCKVTVCSGHNSHWQGAKITDFSTRYSWKNSHFTSLKTTFLQFFFSENHFPTILLLWNLPSYNFSSSKTTFLQFYFSEMAFFYFSLNALKSILAPRSLMQSFKKITLPQH